MTRELYSHPAFFAPDMCRRVRAAMDVGVSEAAEVLDQAVELRAETRRARSLEIDPAVTESVEILLDAQRGPIAAFFGVLLGGREGPGFLRYDAGDFYRPHRDRAIAASWPAAARRQIALVAFLNGRHDFDGGILRIYRGTRTIEVQPDAGLLVAFPADLVHEVTIVRRGTRDAIVDWFYGDAAQAAPPTSLK